MTYEHTLSILKPDVVRRSLIGKVNERIESSGLRIIAQRMILLSISQAQAFYAAHKERSFFSDLCSSMCSGPVVVQVLCGENAILHYRQIMGATNPANAELGTIRRDFAESIEANSVHGSDAPETACQEIAFFFSKLDILDPTCL